MKMLKIFLMVSAVALLGLGCKKKSKPGYSLVKLDEVFELKIGQSVSLKDEDLNLTMTGVPEDSRCPKGVNCIQEGEVKVDLTAVSAGKNMTVTFSKKPSEQNVNKAVGTYKIQLLDVTPYPEAKKKIVPEDYRAKLAVRKVK